MVYIFNQWLFFFKKSRLISSYKGSLNKMNTMTVENHPWFPKTRFNAFLWHLLFSYILFCILVGLIYWVIYPEALFTKAGGVDGVKIIAGVDFILGPALTFFLYNIKKNKKEIISDLAIILVIQMACLLAGSYIVYRERPVVVVYIYDEFVTVKKHDFLKINKKTKEQFKQKEIAFNLFSPKFYYLDLPENNDVAAAAVTADKITGDNELAIRTDLYRLMPTEKEAALKALRKTEYQKCIPTKMLSNFFEGKVCYSIEEQKLYSID